jgi:hypothetical protein
MTISVPQGYFLFSTTHDSYHYRLVENLSHIMVISVDSKEKSDDSYHVSQVQQRSRSTFGLFTMLQKSFDYNYEKVEWSAVGGRIITPVVPLPEVISVT